MNGDGEAATTVTVAGRKYDTQLLHESLKAAEKLHRGEGTAAFSRAQLDCVVDHLVQMMAQTHFRSLPADRQEELKETKGYKAAEERKLGSGARFTTQFGKKLETIQGVYYVRRARRTRHIPLHHFRAPRLFAPHEAYADSSRARPVVGHLHVETHLRRQPGEHGRGAHTS